MVQLCSALLFDTSLDKSDPCPKDPVLEVRFHVAATPEHSPLSLESATGRYWPGTPPQLNIQRNAICGDGESSSKLEGKEEKEQLESVSLTSTKRWR